MNVTIENALQMYQEYVRIQKLSHKLSLILLTLGVSALGLLVLHQEYLCGLMMILFIWGVYTVSANDKKTGLIFKELVGLKGIEVCGETYIFENREYSLLRHEQQGDKVVIIFSDSGFMRDSGLQDSVTDFNKDEDTKHLWRISLIGFSTILIIGFLVALSDEAVKQNFLVPAFIGVVGIFFYMFILGSSGARKIKFIEKQGYKHIRDSMYEKDGKTYDVVVDSLFSYREVPVMTKII